MRPEVLIGSIILIVLLATIVATVMRFGTTRLGGVLVGYIALTGLSMLTPHLAPQVSDWIRHTPYYLARLVFMYFIRLLVEQSDRLEQSTSTPVASPSAASQSPALFSSMALGNFLTHEGLHHLLALPFLLVIVTQVSLNYGYVTARWLRRTLSLGVAASLAFCLTHLAEFVLESQNVATTAIQAQVENIEFGFNVLGLILLFLLILGVNRVVAENRRQVQ